LNIIIIKKKIKLVYKKSLFKNYYKFKLLKSIDYNVIDKEKYDKMKNQWSLVVKYIGLEFIKNDYFILSIHDCFMISANNVKFLKDVYLDYLIKLIDQDYFEKIFLKSLKNNLRKYENRKRFEILFQKFESFFKKDQMNKERLKKKIKESYDAMILG